MTTDDTLTANYKLIATGPCFIEIKSNVSARMHVGTEMPADDTANFHTLHKVDGGTPYHGSENVYMRSASDNDNCKIVYTEVV